MSDSDRTRNHSTRRRISTWFSRRKARLKTLARPRLSGLAFEALEDRRLLAIAAAIPPGISNGLDFLLSVTPDSIKNVIPAEITNFPGTTLAYQAFPQEVNDVSIDGNAFNFFLLLNENGGNVPILRLGPAITSDLIDEIKVGLVDLVADVEFPVAQLVGFDLPDSSAIVPNPQAILQFFPFFDDIANGINDLLDFGIPDITFPEIRFPSLEIPDLGVVCPCEIIPEFELIPEFTLFPGFKLGDVLPDPLVDVLHGITSFLADLGPGGIYISTLDGDDSIDSSNLTGIEQALFGGPGNDTIMPGGGEQLIEALGLPGISGVKQPDIKVFGDSGRDTIVVNRRFDVDHFNVDGGSGNDILLVDASAGNDIIKLVFNADGTLYQVQFLAPNPAGNVASNTVQRLILPANTTGGSFTLTLDYDPVTEMSGVVETTLDILYDPSPAVMAANIQGALGDLANVGAGNIQVTPDTGANTWKIEFIGTLAGKAVPRLSTVPPGAPSGGSNLVKEGGNLTVVRTHEGDATRGTNEMQRITLPTNPDGSRYITGGTFTLAYTPDGDPAETTVPLRHSASPADVQQALEDLPSIEPGDVRVVGFSGGPWLAEFKGNLALKPQQDLVADGSLLTGGVFPTIAQANGAARVQTVTLPTPQTGNASLGGSFTLSYNNGTGNDTTAAVPWNASAAAVQSALENLASIGAGNVTVTGPAGGPWSVALRGTADPDTDPLLVVNAANAADLTGGVVLDVVETIPGSGVNEVQRISAPAASAGTFRLTFNNGTISRTTGALPFDATVGEVQAALEALTSVGGSDNIIVSGTNGGPWDVEFTGELAAEDQIDLLVDGSGLVFDIQEPVPSEVQPGGGGNNEIQQLTAPVATGGTFTLTFDDGVTSETTAPIPFNATITQFVDALNDLTIVTDGDVIAATGGSDGGPWVVEFTGALADTDLDPMVVDGSGLTGLPVVTEQTIAVAGANEKQTISLTPAASSGDFTLTFDDETTSSLPYNATAAEVQAALQALASFQGGKVVVTSSNATGGPWVVEFAGRFAATDKPAITGDSSALAGGFGDTAVQISQTEAGTNEVQTITIPSSTFGGSFRLTFNGNSVSGTTADIPYGASNTDVELALKALSNIGDNDVSVVKNGAGSWTVTFTGALASTDLPLMSINPTKLTLNKPIEVLEVQEAGPTNELQTVTLPAMTTGGTFTLEFDGDVTPPIPFDASPTDVQTILLNNIAAFMPDEIRVRGGVGDPSVRETRAASGGVTEIQLVTLSPLAQGGTFTLASGGNVTRPLSLHVPASEVQTALDIDLGINAAVSGVDGGPFEITFNSTGDQPLLVADGTNLTLLEYGPWDIEFTGSAFAAQTQELLLTDGADLELTGPKPTITELTRGSDGSGAPLVLKTTTFDEIVSIEQLQVNGNGGDDVLIVEGAPNFPLGVIFDGGDGIDKVQLISKSNSPSFVSPIFPDSTQGVLTMDGRQIQIAGLEGGIELNAGGQVGTVSFSGTDEGNDMRFAGVSSDVATIANDGQVTTTLSGFAAGSSLTIRGEQGDDVISVAPHDFTAFENISVFGGGPSGADAIRFEGTAGDDVFVQTPSATSVKAGTMVINGTTVLYDGIEEVGIEGLQGLDSLTVHEPLAGSNDNILFHPAVANDGSFQFTAQPTTAQTALAYYPVTYGSIETRIFATGSGSDILTASTDDLPGVNSSVSAEGGNGTTTVYFGDQPTIFEHQTDGNDILSLEIGTTVDDVTVTPGTGVTIAVNTSLGDDTLIYQAVAGLPVDVSLAESWIRQFGLGDVTFSSTERIAVTGNGGNALSILGLATENKFSYTPQGPQSGLVNLAGVPTSVGFTDIDGTFSLVGGPAVSDEVLVVGSQAQDAIAIDLASRTVRALNAAAVELKPLTVDANIEMIGVDGGPGDDLIRVEVADLLVGAPQVHVDGGAPDASDRLIFIDGGIGNLVLHREGPIHRSGSISIDTDPPVSYENIERVDILPIDPVTGGTGSDNLGRVVVFDTDVFEHNNNRLTPTSFEDLAEATSRPNIDPAARLDPFGQQIPGDEDWYRFDAPNTATLRFELQFEAIGQLANGSAGLPGDGELRVDVYTASGNLIDRLPGEGADSHTIGVEVGETYLLRVRGATPDAVNDYGLVVINTDEIGPRITDVYVTPEPDFDLFDPKPTSGPTPAVNSITIRVEDPVERRPGFLYEALAEQIASAPGHYRLIGDHNGLIAIESVTVVNDPRIPGEFATASIILTFSKPLPDDRFTLTVFDNLVDPVGNRLDGESTAETPQSVVFPTGDGVAGGNFVARFTVDSRPELGVTASTRIYVDINGDFQFDPAGTGDITNRDLIFQLGAVSDAYFAGDFSDAGVAASTGFDKLGAFGWDPFAQKYRFLLDFNHNGVADFSSYTNVTASGLPVAGDFDPAHPGDEIGLFVGDRWYLDTNGDNILNTGSDTSIATTMRGIPLVGDVNGDGVDDLITYDAGADLFRIDLNRDGVADDSIKFGIPDFVERPVVGDLNLDGVDDLGLWVAGSSDKIGEGKAEWYFLLSDRVSTAGGGATQMASALFDPYSPDPLGNDLFANFGDRYSLPIFGNFDPPVTGSDGSTGAGHQLSYHHKELPTDVSGDGMVSPIDALLVISHLNTTGAIAVPDVKVEYTVPAPFLDVNGDRYVSPVDALFVIDYLNRGDAGDGEGEGAQVGFATAALPATPSRPLIWQQPGSAAIAGASSASDHDDTVAANTQTLADFDQEAVAAVTPLWTGFADQSPTVRDTEFDSWMEDDEDLEDILALLVDDQ